MAHKIDLVGQRFGRVTVLEPSTSGRGRTCWTVLCDCGVRFDTRTENLRGGNTKSCGCLRNEFRKFNRLKHGQRNTPEYRAWGAMKERCKEDARDRHNYADRGIYVCDSWLESFENFYADMGARPSGTSLDRIDNDGPYAPNNCRWANKSQQANNTRFNKHVEWDGKRQTVSEWAAELLIPSQTIARRLKAGHSMGEVIALGYSPLDRARACVRACESFSTEAIEAGAVLGLVDAAKEMLEGFDPEIVGSSTDSRYVFFGSKALTLASALSQLAEASNG